LGKTEEALLFGEVKDSFWVSVFEEEEEEDWPAGLPMLWLMKSSPMDFCLSGSAPRPPLWGLGILTGEPLMLTKALMLATDLFTGRFSPAEVPESPLPLRPERTGEPRLLAGDGGAKSLFGEGGTAGVRDGEEGVGGWDFPPSRKPLPLNGIVFLTSCDPEPEKRERETHFESGKQTF